MNSSKPHRVADGLYLASTQIGDWTQLLMSHGALVRLLDCDYSRWAAARSAPFKARFVATRHFAKDAVARVAGVEVDEIELRRGYLDRPSFLLRDSGRTLVADANLSHTTDRVVVAVSTRSRVGVDIEAADRLMDRPGFASAVCHPDELRRYRRTHPDERNQSLLRLWTWKEAVTKAIGTGLTTAFPTLSTNFSRLTVCDHLGGRWNVHETCQGRFQVAIAYESEAKQCTS